MLFALAAAFAAGGAGGFLAHQHFPPSPGGSGARPDETTHGPDAVAALGRLQPLGGTIPVYGPVGDRVTDLDPAEIYPGKVLKTGDRITVLASRAERAKEVQVAETQFAEARHQLELAKKTGVLKIEAAEVEARQLADDEELDKKALAAQVAALEKNSGFAAVQVDRLKRLAAEGVRVAAEEKEQADLLLAKADAEAEAARTRREKALAGYVRGKELAKAKVAAARAELEEAVARVPIDSAKKKLELSRQLLDLTEIKAPVGGVVLKVVSHAGEPTGTHQPILYLADTSRMVAVAEVYESDVARLREALDRHKSFKATLSSPALAKDVKLTGTLGDPSQVTRMIARNAVYALSPREDADRRVVEVTVRLDDESARAAAPYVGLQVNVVLEPGGQ